MEKAEDSKRDSFADLMAHASVTVMSLAIGYMLTFLVIMVTVGSINSTIQPYTDPTIGKWVVGVGAIVSTFIATYITKALL